GRGAGADDCPSAPAPPEQVAGARLGAGHRAGLGLLLRALRAAADAVRRLAAELRSHRKRLLSGRIRASRRPEVHPRTAAILVHAHGLLARDVPPRDPAAALGAATQPVPTDPAPLSSPGQSLDPGGSVA